MLIELGYQPVLIDGIDMAYLKFNRYNGKLMLAVAYCVDHELTELELKIAQLEGNTYASANEAYKDIVAAIEG